jgi:hypothetical protein
MGCDVNTYLVKSDIVANFDYENWWEERPQFPEIDNKSADTYAPYIDDWNGGEIWFLFDELKLPKLRDGNDAWIVIELNKKNIDILIDKTKELIVFSLDLEKEEDFKNTVFEKHYYKDEISERYCMLLRQLREVRECLNKFEGYSVIANINY